MRLAAAVLLVFAILLPVGAEAKWTEVRSANFLFVGNASEGQIRNIAQKLEQFREVMLRALPGAATASPVPTVVLVFDSDKSLHPVKPLFRGNPVQVAGYFQGSEDVNYMAINAEFAEAALSTIYHEYSHALVGNSLGALPVWVSEGLAEVYETLEQQSGGKSALLGRAPQQHLSLLNANTLIPLGDLIGVDHDSSLYNEGTRRGVFYAQSWALVHYLTFGDASRSRQFRQFLTGVRSGGDARAMFGEAFGPEAALERELFEYVRRFSFPAMRFDFDDVVKVDAVQKGRPLDEVDAQIYLADLQSRMGRGEDARARLAAVLKTRPDAPRALVSQGMGHLRGGRVDEALPLLERAVSQAPNDAWAQSALGRALVTLLGGKPNDSALEPTLQRSRTVLGRAVELDANSAFSAAMLGYVEMAIGTDLPRAAALFERAVQLAPAREHYRLFYGQTLIRQGDLPRAAGVLGPLAAGGRTEEVRARARELLGNVAELRSGAAPREAAVPAAASATDLTDLAELSRPELPPLAESPRATEPPRPPEERQSAERSRPMGLDLRLVAIGETRVAGLFRGVECAPGSAVLFVEGDGGPLRLRTQNIDDVDFISYRADGLGKVSCGVFPAPRRVLATYRPGAEGSGSTATAGDVVAIELLPDDETPK